MLDQEAGDIIAATEAADRGQNIVFCVGSVLRGDDAAGPLLAKRLEDEPISGWLAVDGGQTPENDLGYLRRLAPKRLLLVDAAVMELEPGAIRRLAPENVAIQSLITTHTLPITYLLGELESTGAEVTFLGIQPAGTEFFDPVSPAVRKAVERIYQTLKEGADFSVFPFVD